MKAFTARVSPAAGFSLVELLVVISVIAIIASLAIPNFLNITSESRISKNRRNAQMVAAVASSAKAAGVTAVLSGTDAITVLQPPGVSVVSAGVTLSFSVSVMTPDEQEGAAQYLQAVSATNQGVRYVP